MALHEKVTISLNAKAESIPAIDKSMIARHADWVRLTVTCIYPSEAGFVVLKMSTNTIGIDNSSSVSESDSFHLNVWFYHKSKTGNLLEHVYRDTHLETSCSKCVSQSYGSTTVVMTMQERVALKMAKFDPLPETPVCKRLKKKISTIDSVNGLNNLVEIWPSDEKFSGTDRKNTQRKQFVLFSFPFFLDFLHPCATRGTAKTIEPIFVRNILK